MLTEADMRLIGKATAAETEKLTSALAKGFGRAIREHVEKAIAPLVERIEELEKRQAGAMNFRGVFTRAETYKRGDCATSDGALWFCLRDVEGSKGKPGADGNDGWQLTGKSR